MGWSIRNDRTEPLKLKVIGPAGGHEEAAHAVFYALTLGLPKSLHPKPLPTHPPPGGDWSPSPGERPGAALCHLTLVCRATQDPGGSRDLKDQKATR